jgi:hypothetical protein
LRITGSILNRKNGHGLGGFKIYLPGKGLVYVQIVKATAKGEITDQNSKRCEKGFSAWREQDLAP